MRKTPARRRKGSNWKVYVCLLFCFPYGLFLMWRTTRWHPAVKGLVTTCFAALTLAVLLPLTSPPERLPGGVRMVSAERDVEVFGPELPEALDANYTGYSAVTSSNGPVSSDETITRDHVCLRQRQRQILSQFGLRIRAVVQQKIRVGGGVLQWLYPL